MKLFGYLCISAVGMAAGFAIAWMVLPIPALPPVPAPVYQVGGSECYTLSGFKNEANNGLRCAPTVITLSDAHIEQNYIEQGDGSLPDAPMVKAWGQRKRPRHRRKACDAGLFVTRGSRTDIPLRSDGGWRPGQHIEGVTGPLGTIFNDSLTPDVLGDPPCSLGGVFTCLTWQPAPWREAFPQPKPQ